MHSFGLHSPNISFPAVTQKGACSDCIVHSFAFHYLLDEMQILVDMRHMTSNARRRTCVYLFVCAQAQVALRVLTIFGLKHTCVCNHVVKMWVHTRGCHIHARHACKEMCVRVHTCA